MVAKHHVLFVIIIFIALMVGGLAWVSYDGNFTTLRRAANQSSSLQLPTVVAANAAVIAAARPSAFCENQSTARASC
jgi:hypothetical protein